MPGRLVPTSEKLLAFVPDPLPPKLGWTNELALHVSRADLALGQLSGVGRQLDNPHLLIYPFIRREAVLSSRIEGTQASLSDLFRFEAQPKAEPAVGDVREVANYVKALEYGLERRKQLPLSLRLIREIHERLMSGVRDESLTPGEFRKRQVYIGPPGAGIERATFVPPPPAEMTACLDSFEKYAHAASDFPPLVRIALAHYQFEAIHPFNDGNGRVGRLLITLMLCMEGLLLQPLLYLSAYFERHRAAYYRGLRRVSQAAEWTEWLTFFLKGVKEQSDDAIRRADELFELRTKYRDRCQTARSSALLLKLLDELFKRPLITVGRAAKMLKVTPRAAQGNVDRLVALGVLREITGRKRDRVYRADDLLAMLEAD